MPQLRAFLVPMLATAAALGLSGCKPDAEPDPRLADRLVETATVQLATETGRSYTGIVAARVQSDLGFRVQGKIIERLVDTGQVVKAGQPLMRIDPTDYAHAVTAQAGDVAAARAHWVQAAADEQRYRGLTASGAVSHLIYDQAKAASDSAKALLSAAEAQEKVSRNQGDYSVLLADSDGTVVDTLAEPGQVVAPGQTVIRLARAGPREASVDLPETVRPKLGSDASAGLYGDSLLVHARLRQLSDAADPRTRTYEARYVLEGEGALAPLGATVKVHLLSVTQTVSYQVPLSALDDEGKGPDVWVIDSKTRQIARRSVHVTQLGAEIAVVSSGVQPGELIVAMGGPFLRDGERVRLADQKAAMQ